MTAEEFARIILANCMVELRYAPRLAEFIEADRAAAKLEVIAEVFALVAERLGGPGTAQGHVYPAALMDLSDKYAAQVGGGR
jgi:hypothetical protein